MRAGDGAVRLRPLVLEPCERTDVIMKKLVALGVTALFVGAFVIAGCGKTPGGGSGPTGPNQPLIAMNASNFTAHTLTVKANTPVKLDDTVSGGGYHVLCFGTGNGGQGAGSCDKSGNGPSDFYGSGQVFNSGDTKSITFTSAGSYHLICTVHPGMYIDITVQ